VFTGLAAEPLQGINAAGKKLVAETRGSFRALFQVRPLSLRG
jgi:hypothetical protein